MSLAQNSSALAGAAGGAAGEATGMIAQSLYGRDAAHLTEEEKQLVSTLGTLAAGLAGGIVGGDTSSAAAGAAAGKNAVENNALGEDSIGHDDDDLKKEHGDRNQKIIPILPGTGPLLDADGKPIPGTAGVGPGGVPIGRGDGKGGAAVTKPGSGAENAATYPKLKDDLSQQNLNNIAKQDPRLDAVVRGSGTTNPNFSVGMGTATEADRLGKIWVGDGARLLTDGKGLVSADGTRVYRFPASKANTPQALNPTGVQANFETLKDGKRVSNGHMGITQ